MCRLLIFSGYILQAELQKLIGNVKISNILVSYNIIYNIYSRVCIKNQVLLDIWNIWNHAQRIIKFSSRFGMKYMAKFHSIMRLIKSDKTTSN